MQNKYAIVYREHKGKEKREKGIKVLSVIAEVLRIKLWHGSLCQILYYNQRIDGSYLGRTAYNGC